jgi:DNA-nicking Smr family endonuclease
MSDRKHAKPEPKKAEPGFANQSLRDALSKVKVDVKPVEPPKARAVHLPPPLPQRPQKLTKAVKAAIDESREAALFRSAMEDVVPVRKKHTAIEPERIERTPQEVDEDAEALAQLAELVDTGEGMDIADTDEYIEGITQGADRGLLTPLKRGDFSLQAHLDLHGLFIDAAKLELEKFITESRRRGHRCVLIVHGRGLHSKDQVPVLKSRVGTWLSRGKLSRIVLAFATARPADGGAGAVYVLLRK